MIDSPIETNPQTPESHSEPINNAEPINQTDATDQGGWAKMSVEKKRGIKIGAIALILLIIVVIRFVGHRTPAVVNAPPPPAQHEVTQADINNAEQTANTTPTAPNFLNLSLVFYKAKRFNDCIKAARKAIELKPDYSVAYNNVAAGFLGMSAFDSSIAACNKALEIDPNMDIAKNNLKLAIDGKKVQEDNLSKLEKTASDQPTAENYFELSGAYYQAWQFEKSIKAARKAIALKPDYATAYNNICAANNRLGNYKEAQKAGEAALRLDPNNQLAKNNLKWALDQQNKDKK